MRKFLLVLLLLLSVSSQAGIEVHMKGANGWIANSAATHWKQAKDGWITFWTGKEQPVFCVKAEEIIWIGYYDQMPVGNGGTPK